MAERELIARYEGCGKVCWASGDEEECRFQAEHDVVLGLFLYCTFDEMDFFKTAGKKAIGFAGETTDGEYEVVVDHELMTVNVQAGAGLSGQFTHVTFLPPALKVSRVGVHAATQLRFGLSNFTFFWTENVEGQLALPLRLRSGNAETKIRIVRVEGYDSIVKTMMARREARITCEAVWDCDEAMSGEPAEETIDNLCQVLSVACGTKVKPLYRLEVGADGKPVRREYHARIDMRYTSSNLINNGIEGREAMRRFIEMVYPVYVQKREAYRMNLGLIDAYLEAKAEGDNIERRGAKLAICLEMIKGLFQQSSDCQVGEFVIEEKRFKPLAKWLKEGIAEKFRNDGIDDHAIQSVCGKITELNRPPFKTVLMGLFGAIGFLPDAEEISLFVKCRNKLVHTGQFYEPKEQERKYLYRDPPSPEEQERGQASLAVYLFMASFTDRVFLKFLGYSGPYFDRKLLSPSSNMAFYPDQLD